MEVVGIGVLLAFAGIVIYGVLYEFKHIKACVEREKAQQAMYEELLALMKKKSEE